MSFTTNDVNLYLKIANWSESDQYIKDIGPAKSWQDDEILALINDAETLKDFRRNVEICNIPKKDREKRDIIPAFIQASKNVATYRDVIFYNVNGVWSVSPRARRKVLYDVLESTSDMNKFLDFLELDDRSQKRVFKTMNINYIPVGDEYFDVKNGKMVHDAPIDELRTYRLPSTNYKPMKLEDCTGQMMLDLIHYIGLENVRYLMLTVAHNLTGLYIADRRTIILVGDTRTGKGTFGEILKRLHLAPDCELTHDFAQNNDFCDSYAEVSSLFPVIWVDECESVNMIRIKKISSEMTMQVNIKCEPAMTVLNRGVPILTSNRVPTTSLTGIHEKLTIMKTSGETMPYKDNLYFEKRTQAEYEEFINVLLTMAHKLSLAPEDMPEGKQWNPSVMSDEMKQLNNEFLEENFPTDAFFTHWDRNCGEKTKTMDAYFAYLAWCNPDMTYEQLDAAFQTIKLKPNRVPDGLVGITERNFVSDAKCRLQVKVLNGYKYIIGKPPVHGYEGDATLDQLDKPIEKDDWFQDGDGSVC